MTKRDNQIDYIEIPANSVDELIAEKVFFNKVFGWSYKDWGKDYADTQDSGVSSGITADKKQKPEGPLIVIYVTNIEATHRKIVQTGVTITKDLFSFPGGRRFHFKDPSGNEMAVWSE